MWSVVRPLSLEYCDFFTSCSYVTLDFIVTNVSSVVNSGDFWRTVCPEGVSVTLTSNDCLFWPVAVEVVYTPYHHLLRWRTC